MLPTYDIDAIFAKPPSTRTVGEQMALARSKRRPMTPEAAKLMVARREELRAEGRLRRKKAKK